MSLVINDHKKLSVSCSYPITSKTVGIPMCKSSKIKHYFPQSYNSISTGLFGFFWTLSIVSYVEVLQKTTTFRRLDLSPSSGGWGRVDLLPHTRRWTESKKKPNSSVQHTPSSESFHVYQYPQALYLCSFGEA
jgi:hypothetical protein